LFFILAAFPLLSQDDSTLYVIDDYEFSVKGRTLPSALLYKLVEKDEYRKGEIITGKANLEKYLSDITQIYINQRVLRDNVEVIYSTGDQNEDGTYPVTILIKVEDTWNIIALPRPYFKNDVFDLTIKARDYNFFGTMNALQIDAGYNYDEDERETYLLGVYFDIPFMAFGYYWNIYSGNTVQYRAETPVYSENVIRLSMDMPFRSTTFNFGINERFILNQENPDWVKEAGYGTYQEGLYMSTNPYISWRIPTGLSSSRFGNLTYTPSISATFNHELPGWPLPDSRKKPTLNFSHSLGFGNIDWHANYREGLSFSLSNSYQYDFNRTYYDISLNFTGIGHHIFKEYFGVSARFMYDYWYSSNWTDGGYVSYNLRGVADTSIIAYQMLSLNMDFPFRLFLFTPSEWFHNRKFRFFNFEVHIAPVIDLALYYQKGLDNDKKTLYYPAEYAATGGLELVVFSNFMRNLYVRLGFAIDLKEFIKARPIRIPDGDHREIYLIMGHFY